MNSGYGRFSSLLPGGGLLLLLLLHGCSGQGDKSNGASQPQAGPSISQASAGACSTILQSIKAGGSITVNVKCDVPTEAQILSVLSEGQWKSQCPYILPGAGWVFHESDLTGSRTLLPGPGSYFAQFDFRLDLVDEGLSQDSFVYVNPMDWEEVHKQLPYLSHQAYADTMEIVRKYPVKNTQVPDGAIEALHRDPEEKSPEQEPAGTNAADKPVGTLPFRRTVRYEDGSEIVTLKEDIWVADSRWVTTTHLIDRIQEYPNYNEDEYRSDIHDFECSADQSMNLQTFTTLCAMLLEKQTLEAPSFWSRSCSADDTPETDTKD